MKLSINSQLAQLQNSHEHTEEKNKQEEQSYAATKGSMRAKVGRIFFNLYICTTDLFEFVQCYFFKSFY